ncbi:hypothetical protein IP93_01407 [Lysobacter ruishenii]|uniref:Uncharacterized protein n=2 Tax=Aerolutibacter ruishenii TaxID=686800 RepID=A0A562LV40_9GAMM|nr:hypothetical protein IP93_01407 [Lysobacter ruishenii]
MPFALVASLSGHAAGPPLITDDPGTPGDGRWEINLPITLEQTRDERIFEAPLLDINYGLGERTQLKFEVPWLVVDRRDNGTTDGLGNSEIGIKHRFLDEDRHGVSMSIYPQLEFNNPTSSDERGLVDEGMRFKLPVQMTRSAGPFEWYLEAGYEFVEASEDQWLYGVATSYRVHGQLELLAEVAGVASQDFDDEALVFNIGTKIGINDHLNLLLSAGRSFRGSSSGEPELLAYCGLQFLP